MTKKTIIGLASGIAMSFFVAGSSFAVANPSGTGQPNASCEESITAPNGFSSGGFANAQAHYAGSDGSPSQENANSNHAVSQYDVACYQLSNK